MKTLFVIAMLAAFVAITYANPVDNEAEEVYGLLDEAKVAEKYASFIAKYGSEAWTFLKCMGFSWALHCVTPTLECAAAEDLVGCFDLLVCEEKDASTCGQTAFHKA